jgi:hypothetical protein
MPTDECFSDDELNLFLRGGTTPAGELHLSECAACCQRLAQAYRLARPEPELMRVPRRLKARVLRQPRRVLWRAWLYDFRRQMAAMATAVLLVTGVVFLWSRGGETRRPPLTDPLRQTAPLAEAPRLLAPVNGAEINAAPLEFRWAKAEGVSRYNFTLLDERGNIVAQTPTTEERFSFSALPAGAAYFWQVTALRPDGTESESEIRKFVVR